MQEQLQKLAVSKQEVLHCLGIVGAGFLYSLGINLFVVPAGLYTGGIMGFAQLFFVVRRPVLRNYGWTDI